MSNSPLQVLIVEDDAKLGHTLVTALTGPDYLPIRCRTGKAALETLQRNPVDLIILDLGLPDIDGLDLLREIRRHTDRLPVLILTARDTVADKVAGLNVGADDYMVKPFSLAELTARLRAMARRVRQAQGPAFAIQDLQIDIQARRLTRNGEPVALSPREFDLLAFLAMHRNEVVSRAMLAEHVWQYTSRATPIDNVIDVMVYRLREKLETADAPSLIETIRGVGYTIREPT